MAAPCHIQYTTHALNPKFTLMLMNELVSHSLIREKMVIVFLGFRVLLPLLAAAAAIT